VHSTTVPPTSNGTQKWHTPIDSDAIATRIGDLSVDESDIVNNLINRVPTLNKNYDEHQILAIFKACTNMVPSKFALTVPSSTPALQVEVRRKEVDPDIEKVLRKKISELVNKIGGKKKAKTGDNEIFQKINNHIWQRFGKSRKVMGERELTQCLQYVEQMAKDEGLSI